MTLVRLAAAVAATGSTLRLARERRGNAGNYMRLSGTSMAAGVVSGMVALILQTNQDLTPNALKMVLQYSSIPVKNDDSAVSDVLSHGAGSVNGGGALALARGINPTLAIGQKWLVARVTPATVTLNIVWGNRLDDDDNIVWGNSALLGSVVNLVQKGVN